MFNKEGLSWSEWMRAAGFGGSTLGKTAKAQLMQAWKQGENPTEYRT